MNLSIKPILIIEKDKARFKTTNSKLQFLLFQPSVALHIETSPLIGLANQMTGFLWNSTLGWRRLINKRLNTFQTTDIFNSNFSWTFWWLCLSISMDEKLVQINYNWSENLFKLTRTDLRTRYSFKVRNKNTPLTHFMPSEDIRKRLPISCF